MTTSREVRPPRRSRRGSLVSLGASCFAVCASLVTVSTTSVFVVLGLLLTTVEVVAAAYSRKRARQTQRETETLASELAASRARILASGIDARRRIERDLHDGVQQRLVSLGLAVHRAETLAAPDHPALREHLSGIRAGLKSAVDELRDVAHGIHPSVLSDGGLAPALAALARRSPIPVDLTIRAHRRVPDQLELCLYYVASEALTNALKHAQAGAIAVELDLDDSTARLVVRDDGLGEADSRRGSGLVGMADRVQALGGAIQVDSRPGHGTRLSVEVPWTSHTNADVRSAAVRSA